LDLRSGKLYWPTTFPDAPDYPALAEDIECDVLIVGGGSSGAQCAYLLSDTGLSLAVVDKRKAGYGTTIGNMGIVQYFGDKMLFQLANSFGEAAAVRHGKLCEQAIRDIDAAARDIPVDCEFRLRDSLYAASSPEDVQKLKTEFDLLVPNGFRVDWWSEGTICDYFPFARPAALYVRDDLELNPYKFTIGLLEKSRERGALVFENTEITGRTEEPDAVVFHTKDRRRIRAKHAIIAAGFETLELRNDNNTRMVCSYTVVSEPVEDLTDWYRRVLILETARPNLYMRTTPDNRVIIGGLDEGTDNAADRNAQLLAKKNRLIEEFGKLFPRIPLRVEYYLEAFFGGTYDGLPMLGEYAEIPRCTYVYPYGYGGPVYGMMLAKMLRDKLSGLPNEDIQLYLSGRRSIVKSS
jgi:glycine/D-amino acid oxidase-like deaminating enzyme